jgi:subtilisin family serine protease
MKKNISFNILIVIIIVALSIIKYNPSKSVVMSSQNYFYENWEIEYLDLKKDIHTGLGVKIAIIDTIINVTPDIKIFEQLGGHSQKKEEFDEGLTHGDTILRTLKKIAPDTSIYYANVSNDGINIEKEKVLLALKWAIKKEVNIINMSINFPKADEEIEYLLKKAHENKIIIISSTGNDGNNYVSFPASSPYVMGIGAINQHGERLVSSNYGKDLLFSMPGYNIKVENNYVTGTSYSAIIFTGVVSRLMEKYDNTNPNFLIKKLKKMSNYKERNNHYGYGTPKFKH